MRQNSRGAASLAVVALDEPLLSVDGTELDPLPDGTDPGVLGVPVGESAGEPALHWLTGGV